MQEEKNSFESNIRILLQSPIKLGIAVFVFLLMYNFACLNNPPYWDDIMGLHNQAVWLTRNNFNFIELWKPGQGFRDGGSCIYRFGIMPILYGIGYKFFSPQTVHILGHIFNIACISVAFSFSYSILLKFKIQDYLALLCCAAALFEPVMLGRTAALGQECPLILTAVISLYFLVKEKYWKALFFILLAMLIKMTAGLLACAFIVWIIMCIMLNPGRRMEQLKNNAGFICFALALIMFFLFDSFSNNDTNQLVLARLHESIPYKSFVLLPVQALALLTGIDRKSVV